MNPSDPYAPPATPTATRGPELPIASRATPETIAEGLAGLAEHLADPARPRADLAAVEPRMNGRVFLVLGLGVAASALRGGATMFTLGTPDPSSWAILALCLALCVWLVREVFRLPLRARATRPEVALRGYLQALRLRRPGYILATLSPRARAQHVAAPDLADEPGAAGHFAMDRRDDVSAYALAVSGRGKHHRRGFVVRAVRTVWERDDAAELEVEARFATVPTWTGLLTFLLCLAQPMFYLLTQRPIEGWLDTIGPVVGLAAGIVLVRALRSVRTVRFAKTLIRGGDGLWYLLDADLLESAPRVAMAAPVLASE